jgi:hypothetical protein
MLGPTPYLSFNDSPFNGLSFSVFRLEDYEGAPLPGYTAPQGVRRPPGAVTDSVDIDDGALNGSGVGGHSWFSNGQTSFFSFTFDAAALGGRLPTHAGIVWTDVERVEAGPEAGQNPPTPPQGIIPVSFTAYGPDGSTQVGFIGFETLGDGNANGGTAEDRFFGAVNLAGISRIEIFVGDGGLVASTEWEVDHLQFGVANPIPEPEQWLLMALGVGAVVLRLRRRRR